LRFLKSKCFVSIQLTNSHLSLQVDKDFKDGWFIATSLISTRLLITFTIDSLFCHAEQAGQSAPLEMVSVFFFFFFFFHFFSVHKSPHILVIVINRYSLHSQKERGKIVRDVAQQVLYRNPRMCNFIEWKGATL
jgi:hypothetical protein